MSLPSDARRRLVAERLPPGVAASVDAAWSTVCAAAARGERAPQYRRGVKSDAEQLSASGASAVLALVRVGALKSEIFGCNWRVLEVLVGPYTGARTAMPPFKSTTPCRIYSAKERR